MKKRNPDIKNKYLFFRRLKDEPKVILRETILLEAKDSKANRLFGTSEVQHSGLKDRLEFVVQQQKSKGKYGLQLKCPALTKEPFFRFDSDGPAHRNSNPAIPLEKQSIPTPHFNTFDEDGNSIAFRTSALENKSAEQAIIQDIKAGVAHFCAISNSRLEPEGAPSIYEKEPELGFSKTAAFFDRIKFE